MAERQFQIIRRDYKDNIAEVFYTEEVEGHNLRQLANDTTAPPAEVFHEAMDGLKGFIGAPFLVHFDYRHKIRPLRVKLSQKNEALFVQLHGAFLPEGFNNLVHLHVPKQEAEGKLFTAVQAVLNAADGYIDGKRGEESLFDSNGDDADAE